MCKVSVVISVYNTEKYIKDAMLSILNQTYKDLELIVINDGSTDNTAEEIKKIQDERIVFVNQKENHGLIYELNYGISIAKGEYIARLDSDDISYPARIEKQVKYLDEHKDVVLVGTLSDNLIDDKTEKQKKNPVNSAERFKFSLVFDNFCFAHSSFMIRKKVLDENNIKYETYIHVQDYHMLAMISRYGNLACIPEALTGYRIHPEQATQVRTSRMRIDEIDNARVEHIESLEISDSIKKALKNCALRELDSKKKVIQFLDAFNKYAEICGLTDSEEDYACKKYLFSVMMERQRRTAALFLACNNKKVRELLDERFGIKYMIKCLLNYNPTYIKTSIKTDNL